MHKKIMVPIGPEIRDLKSVHYALAAAERLQATVIIVRCACDGEERATWFDEALTDLIGSARLAGLKLTVVEAFGTPEREVVDLVDHERVDLLVLSEDQSRLEQRVLELAPHLGRLMIQVKEKDTMHLETEKGGSRWQS
jgi:hypothetical protein